MTTHPIPSHQTRPVGLVVMCEHWTLKGDCKERGNKERKVHQKIEIAFKLKWKILHELIEPRKKIISEFPLNLIWVHFTGKSYVFFYKRIPCKIMGSFYREILCIFLQKNSLKNFTGKSFYFLSTFRLILKKSYQEGVFDFFYPDPQLVQIFKPTRNLSGQFFYIYIYVYMGIVFNIS